MNNRLSPDIITVASNEWNECTIIISIVQYALQILSDIHLQHLIDSSNSKMFFSSLSLQIRYLDDAAKVVRQQAFLMKRALDGDNLKLVSRIFGFNMI